MNPSTDHTDELVDTIEQITQATYFLCNQRLAALERECEGLRADAERYRWLRDTPWTDTSMQNIVSLQKNALWDDAIDALRLSKTNSPSTAVVTSKEPE